MYRPKFAIAFAMILAGFTGASADDGLVRHDLDVAVKSTAPSIAGQQAHLYVREVTQPGLKGAGAGVVLFVHGVGLSSPSFDVPYKDYSWAGFLAKAGFDVFALDLTGYGHSTRPAPMADPCNIPKAQQPQFVPTVLPAPCPPSSTAPITTISSDADDIAAVVDDLRARRHVDKIAIVAWSLGGARTVNYLAHHSGAVSRLVLLAPLYNSTKPLGPLNEMTYPNGPMSTQSQAEFTGAWKHQSVCPGEIEDGVTDAFWPEVLAADPVGTHWGVGVRRAPQMPAWNFNRQLAGQVELPVLLISGANDTSAPQQSIRDLYADLGSKDKVFIDIACTSHYAMLEKNHRLFFQASLEWLRDGKVAGQGDGQMKMGY